MYYHVTSTSFSRLRLVVVCAVLLVGAVKEGYGQRVYADSYGASESGPGLTVLGAEVLSAGLVTNPENAIEPNSLNAAYTQLRVGGLLGNAYAIYQIEFIHNEGNLPAGTSVYIRLDNNTNVGLLNLALASAGFVSAYQNADSNNDYTLTGTEVPLNEGEIETPLIGGQQYLKITPSQCFNALRLAVTSQGLLGLLATGNIRIYHAYYECLEIAIPTPAPICEGETITLQVDNPASCGTYDWYTQATGGTAFHTGTSYATPTLSSSVTYYIEYSGVDANKCGRTSVTVTVLPQPGKPHLTITDVHN